MELGDWGLVVTVVLAHLIALLSPGPDFILVVKSGIRNTTKNAIGVAFGIASANAIYIILCLIGVGAILASSIVVMTVIKVLGGIFLIYIAFSKQILPGTFEYTLDYLNKGDRFILFMVNRRE